MSYRCELAKFPCEQLLWRNIFDLKCLPNILKIFAPQPCSFVSNFFSGNAWSTLFKSILVIWSLSIFPDELKASLLLAVLCSSNKMVCWYFRNRKQYLFLWSLRSRLKKKLFWEKLKITFDYWFFRLSFTDCLYIHIATVYKNICLTVLIVLTFSWTTSHLNYWFIF